MSLREILLNIFKRDIGGPDITLFGIFHILYFLIIIGVTILLIFLFNKKDQSVKKKLLDIYCLILM